MGELHHGTESRHNSLYHEDELHYEELHLEDEPYHKYELHLGDRSHHENQLRHGDGIRPENRHHRYYYEDLRYEDELYEVHGYHQGDSLHLGKGCHDNVAAVNGVGRMVPVLLTMDRNCHACMCEIRLDRLRPVWLRDDSDGSIDYPLVDGLNNVRLFQKRPSDADHFDRSKKKDHR